MAEIANLPASAGALAELTRRELWHPRQELLRAGTGVGLASAYGLALGARAGGVALARHALGASFALSLLSIVLVSAVFVVLALVDAPVLPGELLSAAARALVAIGLVLGSIAPAAAMLTVTIQAPAAAAAIGWLGLVLAGGIGMLAFASALREPLERASTGVAVKACFALLGFGVLSIALAVRAFGAFLPVLRGGA